jgi:hypothetical protein
MSQSLIHTALKPLFTIWLKVVGLQVAATPRVSVGGGLYIQAREIRCTTVSIIYFSCVTKSGYSQLDIRTLMLSSSRPRGIDRFKIRDQIAESDRRFTVNTEKICSLTFREKVDDVVTPIDIIDDKVVSPNYCSSSSLVLICHIRRLCTCLRA